MISIMPQVYTFVLKNFVQKINLQWTSVTRYKKRRKEASLNKLKLFPKLYPEYDLSFL